MSLKYVQTFQPTADNFSNISESIYTKIMT